MARHLPSSASSHLSPQRTAGEAAEVARLLPLVYDELRGLAGRYLQQERRDHTLQATALVHEAYLRLTEQKNVHWESPAQFFTVAATFMRRILVNHAKRHRAAKHGGNHHRVALDTHQLVAAGRDPDLVALDDALSRLAQVDQRKARVVELRYFAGLGIEETAEVLAVSVATIKRDWLMARAWLLREISGSGDGSA